MKEFVDKLIEKLTKVKGHYGYYGSEECEYIPYDYSISIINELADEYNNDFCEWKFTKSVVNGGYFYSSSCNHKRFSDLHNFEFCPYCGKKIKVVTIDG